MIVVKFSLFLFYILTSNSQSIPVNYRMLTPLIRIQLDVNTPFQYQISPNITIIANNTQVFHNFNIVNLSNFTSQHFSGMSSMVFTYNPLLITTFPFVKDFPEHADATLKLFLDALALFKTTTNTKLKDGPRIIQSLTAQPLILGLVIRGSDDTSDFQGKRYPLSVNELDEFRNFYNKLVQYTKTKENKILPAIDFYSKASRHFDITEKFIFLSLSLESLFSKESDELSYRFSNRISLLLGNSFEEREKIAKSIKNVIYQRRSKIVHGTDLSPPSEDEYEYLNEVIRVSILRYLSLINNGILNPIDELDSFLLKQNTHEYDEFKKKSLLAFSILSELKFQNIRKKPSK